MPKTTPRSEAPANGNGKNDNAPKYVACDLTAEQKRSLDAFIESTDLEDLHKWMSDRVTLNHVISIRGLDVGFQCALSGTKGNSAHENVSLISRSSTPERAMWSVMFKDVEVLKGIWPVTNRLEDLD